MLSTRNLISLRKEELLQFIHSIHKICVANDPDKLFIQHQVNQLAAILEKMDKAMVYDREKAFTKKLEDLDRLRDEAWMGLRYGFLMYAYSQNSDKKTAAQLLLRHMEGYGTMIHKLNYEAESTVIRNFLEDSKTNKDVQEALKTISMTDWISQLQVANDAFMEKYHEKIEVESALEKNSVTIFKPEALDAYEKLINRIKAYVELDEKGAYDKLYKELTTVSDRYLQIIRTRKQEVAA